MLLFFSMKHIIEIDSCRGNHQARYPAVLYLTALSQLISISLFLEGEGGWELAKQ